MLICTAFHAGDVSEALRLFRWILKLSGRMEQHKCLLVADPSTPFDKVCELMELAGKIFGEARLEVLGQEWKGWPQAANAMFSHAAKYVVDSWPQPFLWLEPDCVPLRASWLDDLGSEYAKIAKHFMGHVYDTEAWQPHLPKRVVSGVAVYPGDTADRLCLDTGEPRAWDMVNAELVVEHGAHTNLIRHRWGMAELPPTFVESRNAATPTNAFTVDQIHAECVLFHRSKDGTLIEILNRKLFPEDSPKMIVVFPVHNGDIAQAVRHAEWMIKLGRKHEHDAIISHDPSCSVISLNRLESLVKPVFKSVSTFVYPLPPVPTYPGAANWAWQNTALHMQHHGKPWLWLEADACVLRADWLDQLQAEYDRAGHPFMGPHVQGMNHSNGTMIYPPETPRIMVTAMRLLNEGAFDYTGANEYMARCHDCSHLMHHCWTILNDMPCEVGGGELPVRMSAEQARRWIKLGAVLFHRLKSTDLIEHLLSGAYRP